MAEGRFRRIPWRRRDRPNVAGERRDSSWENGSQGSHGVARTATHPASAADRTNAVTFTLTGEIRMQEVKKEWVAPEVQRYGTFESATQYCDKQFGGADGFTFMGNAIVCAS